MSFCQRTERLDFLFPLGICRASDSQSYPDISGSLKTEYCWLSGYPARGVGTYPAHPSHPPRQTCLGFQINLQALSFQIGDRIRFRAIQMHDGESVGITEGCNESEPNAQGGDEMIHPVRFASITDN